MNTLTPCAPIASAAHTTPRHPGLGWLLIVDALLSFAPVAILGAAVPVAAAVSLLSGWMIAAGVWLMRPPRVKAK